MKTLNSMVAILNFLKMIFNCSATVLLLFAKVRFTSFSVEFFIVNELCGKGTVTEQPFR